MATNLAIYANSTNTDDTKGNVGIGNDAFILIDLANDYLVWSEGSAAVADDQDEPTNDELNEAAMLIEASANEADKLFLYDNSQLKLKLIDLAGSADNRYVFCLAFDGATATEPTLEAWDSDAHTTANYHCLGNGTPANSFISAVLTTGGSPGASWVGTKIAGSTQKLLLNGGGGALGGATDIYFNIKAVVPASYTQPAAETPVLTVRYTWN